MTDRSGPSAGATAAQTSGAAAPDGETTATPEVPASTTTTTAGKGSEPGTATPKSPGVLSAESVAEEEPGPAAATVAETVAEVLAGGRTPQPPTTAAAPTAADPAATESAAPGQAAPEQATAAPDPTAAPTAAPAAHSQSGEAEASAAVLAASVPEGDGDGPEARAAASVGRPGRPLLAGAAVLGALLIAVPGLLMNRDRTPDKHDEVVAGQTGTVLGGDATPDAGAAYASSTPSAPGPSAKPRTTPHRAAPAGSPAAHPGSGPTTAAGAKKPAAKPKATHKATAPKPPAAPALPSEILVRATRVLNSGQSLNAKKVRLRMQTDGNLVIYDEHDKPRWATMTFGSNYHAVFQADGNLCVYTSDNRPVWASQTPGHAGAVLRLQGDGNMVIYDGGSPIWATNTPH